MSGSNLQAHLNKKREDVKVMIIKLPNDSNDSIFRLFNGLTIVLMATINSFNQSFYGEEKISESQNDDTQAPEDVPELLCGNLGGKRVDQLF